MVANCDRSCPLSRRMLIAVSALAIGFSLTAAAQTATTPDNSASAPTYSSSNWQALLSPDAFLPGGGSSSAEPTANAIASPQYGGQRNPQYPGYESRMSHIAFEGGVGVSIPVGPDTSYNATELANGYLAPSEGVGYAFNVGAGWYFSRHFATLIEFSFDRQGIPSGYLNALSNASGVAASGSSLGGNINTWDLALEPIYYFTPNRSGAYITGGGGFYRKVTNFTEPVESCDYYGYCFDEPATVDHFSSNQGGANLGLGWYWKVFGRDSNGKLFAEARYVWVNSPKPVACNYYQGEGSEELIPITFGVRF
jgi:hypothetical protein